MKTAIFKTDHLKSQMPDPNADPQKPEPKTPLIPPDLPSTPGIPQEDPPLPIIPPQELPEKDSYS